MKTSFCFTLVSCLLGAAVLMSPCAQAVQALDAPAKVSSSKKAKSAVGKALAGMTFFNNEKANTRAKYYIYLCSASWCGPCNNEMPHVVEAYKKMKKSKKVELILVSCDSKQEDAEAFLEKFGAEFPAVMSTESSSLPGFTPPRSIPSAIIVDAKGNVVKSGHGSIASQWEQVISDYKKEKKEKKDKKEKKSE